MNLGLKLIVFESVVIVPRSFSPTFFLDKKSSKKIKAVEKILEILNIFGRPTQTPHSFKNGKTEFDFFESPLDIFKTARQTGVALCPTMLGFLRIFSKAVDTNMNYFAKKLKVSRIFFS
jgi:hypothetical protein